MNSASHLLCQVLSITKAYKAKGIFATAGARFPVQQTPIASLTHTYHAFRFKSPTLEMRNQGEADAARVFWASSQQSDGLLQDMLEGDQQLEHPHSDMRSEFVGELDR